MVLLRATQNTQLVFSSSFIPHYCQLQFGSTSYSNADITSWLTTVILSSKARSNVTGSATDIGRSLIGQFSDLVLVNFSYIWRWQLETNPRRASWVNLTTHPEPQKRSCFFPRYVELQLITSNYTSPASGHSSLLRLCFPLGPPLCLVYYASKALSVRSGEQRENFHNHQCLPIRVVSGQQCNIGTVQKSIWLGDTDWWYFWVVFLCLHNL